MNAKFIVGYDNFLAHYEAGYWMADLLTMKYGEPKGKIGQIWGPGGHWSVERNNGFMEAMKNFPDIGNCALSHGEYHRDSGMAGAEDLLTVNPDLDIIYGENEEMGLGAAAGALAQGIDLGDFDSKDGMIVIGANRIHE
ncbi:MAG: substrate-binding domain-containing protein [Actinomycetota bacterium]|nr:substrate-binding domain-containing protein [Actinomycetota bacterium]